VNANARAALLQGRGPVVVCLLTLPGGTQYAFGTEAIEVRRLTGPAIQASGGLVIDDFESVVDPFALSGETALTQAQVSVVLPTALTASQGDWRYVGAASAELARVWPGDAWEHRESMLAGTRLSGVSIGVAGAPTTFTVEAAQPRTSAMIGDPSRDMGADFPTPLDITGADLTSLSGVQYPNIHGAPYRAQAFKIGEIAADGYDRLVIGGEKFANLSAINVYEDGVALTSYAVHTDASASGIYAYVRSATPNVFGAANGAFTVAPQFGGSASVNGTDAALTAGDLLELWLSRSGLPVDWARCRPAIARLKSWTLGAYLDNATTAIDAIRDHLVRLAPLIELQSADGVWFYYADLDTPIVRGVLTEGQEIVGYAGGVSLSEIEDVRNEVTVRYALDEFTGEFTASVTVNGDTDAAAYVSAQLYGAMVADTIDAPEVKDVATARRVGRSLVHRRAYQRRRVTVLLSDYAEVTVGEVYDLVMPTFSIHRNAVLTSLRGVVGRLATFTVLDGPL